MHSLDSLLQGLVSARGLPLVAMDEKSTTLAVILPGRSASEVSVKVDRGTIRVTAPEKSESGFTFPAVSRTFSLRAEENVTANMRDGILYLSVTRPEPRSIPVAG